MIEGDEAVGHRLHDAAEVRTGALRLALLAVLGVLPAPVAFAQSAVATAAPVAAAPTDDPQALVARIALYPDDLIAIILPASTNPLQIVQAERFLAKRKSDPKTPVDDKWDDSVKSLVNYPEVVTMMSATSTGPQRWRGGRRRQGAVLRIQASGARRSAGNLSPISSRHRGREGSDHHRKPIRR